MAVQTRSWSLKLKRRPRRRAKLLAAMSLCSKGERAFMVSLQLGKVLVDDDHLQVRMAVIIFVLK